MPGPVTALPTAAVVEERVHRLLKHALLVVDDDLGRAEVEQPLQPVVAVDDTPVEIVQVAGREPAAVELHHGAKLGRDHRNCLEDHPLGPVLGLDEGVDDLETLDRALLLLALGRPDRFAERLGLGVEVELLEQVADRLGAHAALEVDAEPVSRTEPVLELAEDELVVDDLLGPELAEAIPGLLEPAYRLDARLTRVLTTGLHVLVHLTNLQRPLDDRLEVFLLHPAFGLQAEVVRKLADLVG